VIIGIIKNAVKVINLTAAKAFFAAVISPSLPSNSRHLGFVVDVSVGMTMPV
jgi:hypothetical protein